MNMISTGTFLPEMDASDKQETVAEKFARVWEKKNAKAARAGGVSLMALSLAACGSDSSDPVVEVEEEEVETPVVETVVNTYDLTDDDAAGVTPDAISGQDGENDIITGAAGTLDAADVIVDDDATDADELNITLTAAGAAATVDGIESINVDFDMLTGASFDATNVGGATITLTSDRFGYDGAATVTASGANNVTMGAGVTDLTVTDAGAGTLNGGAGDSITLDTLDYSATRVAVTNNVTVNGDIALNVDIDENATSDDYTLNITATEASDVTLVVTTAGTLDGSDGVFTINNTGDATIVVDMTTTSALQAASDFAEVHINGGRIELTDSAAIDMADIEVTEVEITATTAITVSNAEDSNLLVSVEDADVTVTGDGNALTASEFAITYTDNQNAGSLDIDVGAGSISAATINIAAADGTNRVETHNAISFAGALTLNMTDDLTITTLTSAGTTNAGGTAYTDSLAVAGAGDLTIGTLAANQHIDAERLAGGVTATTAGGTLTINIDGGSGDDDITLADATNTVDFAGHDGDDTLDATTMTAGTLIADGGAGDDTITIGTTTGTAEVLGGAGDDMFVITGLTTGTVSIDGGAGTDDNLDLGAVDTTGATLELVGIEVIEMGGSVAMDASVINGLTLTFESDTGTGTLTITEDSASGNGTIDTSNFTLSEAGGLVVDDIAITVAGTDTVTLGANVENISITGAAAAYTDVDGSGNVDDGDTFLGDFSTITGYDQGTVAGGAITTAEDTLGTRLNNGALQGDEAAYNGTWDAVTSTFTVNDTAGTDCIVYSAGLGTAVVHLDTTDLIIA